MSLTMMPPADLSSLSPSEKDALIAALLARVKALLAEVEELRTENAALRDKLSLPPGFTHKGLRSYARGGYGDVGAPRSPD